MKGLATTDSLTGLENRLSFDAKLKRIGSEYGYESDWTMLMIDVNGLKYTNDTFGHQAGDALISCYRDAMSLDFCREEIQKNLGKMYDPAVGKTVLDVWDDVVGELLKMHSGASKRRS